MSELVSEIGSRTRKRVMRRLVPYLMLVYLLAYVDRANLSVAKLQMQSDLGFTDRTIGLGAGIFFLGYMLLEIPGSLIVERWSARKWIARIMISWGVIAALCGFLGTKLFNGLPLTSQFYALRFLLGAAEAGFFPGVIVYLSHWFRSEDRARAKAYFLITQPLALLVGVPLSRWLMESIHTPGVPGWRWLFVLEGLPSVILGFVTLFFLTDRPEHARWLPDDERRWLQQELEAERLAKEAGGRMRARDFLRQPRVLMLALIYFLIVAGNQGFVFFFPTLLEQIPHLSVTSKTLLSGLPYVCGIFGILLTGLSAHRRREQRWHTALPMLINGAALIALIFTAGSLAPTLLMYAIVGFTLLAYLPSFWTLPTLVLGGSAAAIAVGFINSVGNLGGFAGPSLFGSLRTATGADAWSLGIIAGCTLLAGLLSLATVPARGKQRPQPAVRPDQITEQRAS